MNQQAENKRQAGFTLIELLVMIAASGIMAAIALPRFDAYKTRSFNTKAQNDLRSALVAEETYFVNHDEYLACDTESFPCAGSLPGFFALNDGVRLQIAAVPSKAGGINNAYVAASCHQTGDALFTFDSGSFTPNFPVGTISSYPASSLATCGDLT